MARQRWGRRIEFFLTSVGFSVGVGDLWRFPYLVMKNGGGAFLICVVVFNVLGAMPIIYLEMIMGQYSQTGAVPVWNVCPLFKGVGYGTITATFLFSIYYGVIICWMLYYLYHSFFPNLPWNSCDNDWNIQETCVTSYLDIPYGDTTNTSLANMTSSLTSGLTTMASNATTTAASAKLMTSAEQFWKYRALESSGSLEVLGDINWPVLGALAIIEVACFLCIFRGVKLTGKIVYFTVLGPFIILIVFLIRGAILPGADIGIKFYLSTDLEKLKDIQIWAEACMQVFVSVGPGFGGMITFASYNKFSNNCMRDAILVCLMDLFTGFLSGFVVFSVLGHMSYKTGIDIAEFESAGYGLGFIAYPQAANYLPPPQLWCVLFFFMSIFLGLDSQFPNYEIVVTAIKDEFPKKFGNKTILLTVIVIVLAFLLAIPQVTQGGFYLLTLVDWYAATFSVTIFALIELLVMMFVYGLSRVDANMKEMTGKGVPLIFKIAWCFTTPLLLTVTLGFTVYTYSPPATGDYVYPPWAVGLGWCIAAASIVPIPIYMIYKLIVTPGTLKERFQINLRPNEKWGPPKEITDAQIVTFDEEKKAIDGLDNPGFHTRL